MRLRSRRFTFFCIGTVLVIVGIAIIIAYGITSLNKANEERNKKIELSLETNIARSLHIYDPSTLYLSPTADKNYPYISEFYILFNTTSIFVGNHVRYDATAVLPHPKDVQEIAIVFAQPSEDFSKYTRKTAIKDIEMEQFFQTTIQLFPSNKSTVSSNGIIPFWSEGRLIPVTFVFTTNGTDVLLPAKDQGFIVYPAADQLQVETNLAILKQIEQSQYVTNAQNTTNYTIEGLTFVGVALAPLLLGGEILIRVFLDPFLGEEVRVENESRPE